MVWDRIKKLFSGGNTLYYPGCMTRFVLPEIEENYKKILNLLEIDYITIPEFNCCGSPVKNAGYQEDFVKLIEDNKEIFKKYNVKRIITNCPGCRLVFRDYYGIDVKHITEVMFDKIDLVSHEVFKEKVSKFGEVTYHDPCHLGRLGGVYDQPREILKKLGLKVIELPCSKVKSLCCGAGAGLRNNNPKLARKIAEARLDMCKTKHLVTTCPMCYHHFKDASQGIEIIEFSQLFYGKENEDKQQDIGETVRG